MRLRELLKFRRPFYESAADIMVDTSDLDIDAVVELIMSKLKGNESFSFEK